MPAMETSPLLNHTVATGHDADARLPNSEEDIDAVAETWQLEAKVLGGYSAPLILSFLLQQSLTVASVLTVGHMGTAELASVSLASMTANITGYAIYQGLATSLDTLCAQAYGAGRKELVGLCVQRMLYFLWTVSVPIGVLWVCYAEKILGSFLNDGNVAHLAGQYLMVVFWGTPGFAAFEAIKRFVQAQGQFSAPLYVLLVCAPVNALLNWLLVWKLDWGFIGAPVAVAITNTLLPICLIIYIRLCSTDPSCWTGFSGKAFQNWGPMIQLSIPGVLMIEAEVLAFELLTLAASRFGTTTLAAQSVLATLLLIEFQIPFSLSIATSTRIGTHIGAGLTHAARKSLHVALGMAVLLGLVNMTLFVLLRGDIPLLFTSDADVIQMISAVLPLFAGFQLFDALATTCNGILRGLGRQEIGGYVQLFCYYSVGLPLSYGLAFGLQWSLSGLWSGVAIALVLVAAIELVYIFHTDWERSVAEAKLRNWEGDV